MQRLDRADAIVEMLLNLRAPSDTPCVQLAQLVRLRLVDALELRARRDHFLERREGGVGGFAWGGGVLADEVLVGCAHSTDSLFKERLGHGKGGAGR